MSIDHVVSCVAESSVELDDEDALIAGAEREMGAFFCAVRQRLGVEAARRAAGYWIDAFEAAAGPSGQSGSALRKVTIAAASRLALEAAPSRFVGELL